MYERVHILRISVLAVTYIKQRYFPTHGAEEFLKSYNLSLKKFPQIYGIHMFIILYTSVRHF
jgi:hypothetical protein